jgi:hypothetical protein
VTARWPPDHTAPIAERTRCNNRARLTDIATDDGRYGGDRHSLLIGRHDTAGELACYRRRTPGLATLAEPVQATGIR